MTSSRGAWLAIVSWVVAGLTFAGLALAVVHYLATGSGPAGHAGMSMPVADALTRAGGNGTLPPLTAGQLFTAWHLDAIAVALVVVVAATYLTGVALVPVRSPGTPWPARRTVAFLAGLAVCVYATNGCIAVYDQALFTAHMAGHLALVMVAPALLIAGRPLTLALAAAPPRRRFRLERLIRGRVMSVLTAPPVALAGYAVVIVGSHLTGLMDTIMRNTWAGQVEHVVYVLAGCQFFVLVVGEEPIRWRLASPARWLLLAIAMAVDTFTGVVLMQGTAAVALVPAGLGVDALSDTHTGGAIMWFGGDAIMALIMIGLVLRWLRSVESRPAERGWLEQARGAAFNEHVRAATPTDTVDDEDDDARVAYNEWLAKLGQRG